MAKKEKKKNFSTCGIMVIFKVGHGQLGHFGGTIGQRIVLYCSVNSFTIENTSHPVHSLDLSHSFLPLSVGPPKSMPSESPSPLHTGQPEPEGAKAMRHHTWWCVRVAMNKEGC